MPRFSVRRVLFFGGLLLLAAGLIAPYLHADRFGQRIRQALEDSLDRRVDIGEVRLSLFRGPGFSVRRVVIQEDPAAGIEPFAYVGSIEARLRLRSFWTGRLEFSSLRFVDPSVNLVKMAGGSWNFQPLLSRAARADLPEIHVRRGRLNFKFGDVKSVFYFADSDLDLVPPSRPGGTFDLVFSGEPGRTDRAAHGFGRLTGQGRWLPSRDAEPRMELDLSLRESAIGEVVTLMHGHDIGVHGRVAARARLHGPISSLEITGGLQLQDIHRWDLMPPYAEGGPLNFLGRLDLLSQRLELETIPSENSSLSVRFRAEGYLSKPQWAVSLTLNQLPVEPLLEVARHMGAPLPQPLRMAGSVDGEIGYSPEEGFQGGASLRDALVSMPGASAVRFEEAHLRLDGNRVHLPPATLRMDDGETAQVELDYALGARRLDLRITTGSLSLANLRSQLGPLLGMARLPFVQALREGTLAGWLRFRREQRAPGKWSAALELQDTQVSVAGVADPVRILAGKLNLRGDRVVMEGVRALLGEAEIEGDYRYQPGARRPHQFRCRMLSLGAMELERLLLPTLRRRQGFLSRTFGLGRKALPEWLRRRHVEGTLEIGSLSLAELRFETVRARLFWDQSDLQVTNFSARMGNGRIAGHLSVDLSDPEPTYVLGGRIQSMNWKGGTLDGDGLFKTSGTGAEVLLNLRAEGSFTGRSVDLGPDSQFKRVSGCYDFAWARNQVRLSLTCLRLTQGSQVFIGQGVTGADGRLLIEISKGEEQVRLIGSLAPLQLHVEESP
jgi:AsmA protein